MTNEYPVFILKAHVIESISKKDADFAKQLTDPTQSFTYDRYYYAPSMSDYVIRIPFEYEGDIKTYGKAIAKDFKKLAV